MRYMYNTTRIANNQHIMTKKYIINSVFFKVLLRKALKKESLICIMYFILFRIKIKSERRNGMNKFKVNAAGLIRQRLDDRFIPAAGLFLQFMPPFRKKSNVK